MLRSALADAEFESMLATHAALRESAKISKDAAEEVKNKVTLSSTNFFKISFLTVVAMGAL